jgi:hypothetical protein
MYNKEVVPEINILGKIKIEMAHLLHEKRKNIKLSKADKTRLDNFIFDLLDDAFHVVVPTEKDKKLFATYNDLSYEDEINRQQVNRSEMFADMLYRQTGIKIDPAMLNENHPDFEKAQADLDAQLKEMEERNESKRKTKRKKSKQAIDKEAKEKQKEELKQKSIRSIYLSLAKMLHPDTETDHNIRIEKEEYMKQVTAAYNDKNLSELLTLEMQWVHKHENQLVNTPEETLKLYNELLKEQIENLKEELFFVTQNPAYNAVAHLSMRPLNMAVKMVNDEKKEYMATHKNYTGHNSKLKREENIRAAILNCLDSLEEPDEDDLNDYLMQMLTRRFR